MEREPSRRDPHPRVLIVGAGAIGGVLGAHLLERGHDVTLLTTNAAIAAALAARGIELRGAGPRRWVRGAVRQRLGEADAGRFDFVVLAVQPPQVEQAARDALPALAPDGRMVCLQNGLCEPRVAVVAGERRTLGAVVAWGASMVAPGVYERTSAGGFALGRLDGALDPRMRVLANIFSGAGPVNLTTNLLGARFSKLAINCAVSSLGTVAGVRLGSLLRQRVARRLALEVVTEVVAVARAEGVRLEPIGGTLDLDWIALEDEQGRRRGRAALAARHAAMVLVGLRFRRLRSSMLAAIERGRAPAVEFLNGEVVERAARHGVPAPVNAMIRETIWRIARGEAKSDPGLLRAIDRETRTTRRAAGGHCSKQ